MGWGVVLIAGTGNNCRGRDKRGREARITGEGGRFGEFGGAGEMVEKAVQAVSHEWTHRGPKTALTKMFIEMTGAKDLDELIEGHRPRLLSPRRQLGACGLRGRPQRRPRGVRGGRLVRPASPVNLPVP